MQILVLGLSHKTAPVELRERLAFNPQELQAPLRELQELPEIEEACIVSTCNRVEIYAVSRYAESVLPQVLQFLANRQYVDPQTLNTHLYSYQGQEAVQHLFRVAASLDSMVVGEPQIVGQLKDAYSAAQEAVTAGTILNRLFHKAFSVAKKVRNETGIANNAVSVSFAAVELARKIFAELAGKKVILIGAGEMCELAARHFVSNGVSEVLVTNRTFSRAQELAAEFNGRAVLFENFQDHLAQVDIVLSSTGAEHYILAPKTVSKVLRQRKNRPMFFIDIAVPRDVDPRVNELDNAYLYDVDDLQEVVAANLKERQEEAHKAEDLVLQEVAAFWTWVQNLEVVPTIVALRQQMEELRQAEMAKTMKRLNHLSTKEQKAVEAMSRALVNKMLHHPTQRLKEAGEEETMYYLDALQQLFAIELQHADYDAIQEMEQRADGTNDA